MLRITYRLKADHFLIQQGKIKKEVREPVSERTLELSLDGRKVTAVCKGEDTRTLAPSHPIALEPDPTDICEETSTFAEADILHTICQYDVTALLSLYREERLVENGCSKRQSMSFFTVRIQDEKEYLYADIHVRTLEEILKMHSLPRKKVDISLVPFVLSRNVVGHIFHEYVHTLERDICEAEPDMVVGNPIFDSVAGLTVCEDPELQTVGHTAFSDEGAKAQKTLLINDNTIVGFVDSLLYPYYLRSCGYLGYGSSFFPLPRSVNLRVSGKCEQYNLTEYVEITELDMELLSLDPLKTMVSVAGGEGLYITDGIPSCRVRFSFSWQKTIQELLSDMIFIDTKPILPSFGGICVKNGIPFRSAQTAPLALWRKTELKIRS